MLDLLPFSPTWVLVGLCLVLFYLYAKWPYSFFKNMGIDGPKPTLLFGNFLDYKEGRNVFDIKCYKKYGKVYGIYEGRMPILAVGDLEIIKEVTVKQFNNFANRRVFGGIPKEVEKCLLFLKDDDWQRVRRAISPTLGTSKLKQMTEVVEKCGDNFAANLAMFQKEGAMFDVKELASAFTVDSIWGSAFGVEVDSLNDPNHPFLTNAKDLVDLNLFSPFIIMAFLFPSMAKLFEWLGISDFKRKPRDFFAGVVENVLQMKGSSAGSSSRVDVLQLMLKARNESLDKPTTISDVDKHGISMTEIKSNANAIWLGGQDPIVNTMSLVAYSLAVNPEAQDKVIEEIADVMQKRGKLDYEAVNELSMLEMCINETLRMYPSIQRLDRVCGEDIEVKGLHIPAGMNVSVNVSAIHYDPEIWPEPEKFKPERFTKEEKENRDPYAFQGFGSGPRHCVAGRFAMLALKIPLAKALEKFRLVTCDKTEIPIRLTNSGDNRIDGGVWLKVEAHTPAS